MGTLNESSSDLDLAFELLQCAVLTKGKQREELLELFGGFMRLASLTFEDLLSCLPKNGIDHG